MTLWRLAVTLWRLAAVTLWRLAAVTLWRLAAVTLWWLAAVVPFRISPGPKGHHTQ
ncbi:hypothetical protein [Rhodococcus sp. WB1]|uniref:hypothetical protein n=1 Tax=Rhodococcus sp. WB1 TaxID=1033922 RepID=UPI000B27F2BB|nr:hypothetical protein [Rhodococcus sp. WB1]